MQKEDRYDSLIQFYAEQYNVDWRWIKEQIRAESGFDPNAQSTAGAKGLSQFMDKTWREWEDGTAGIQSEPPVTHFNVWNPELCIRAQCAYFNWIYEHFKLVADPIERTKFTFASYNAGLGNIFRAQELAKQRSLPTDRWVSIVQTLQDVTGRIMSAQTTDYVAKIVKSFSDQYNK